mmetsp:Transcript_42/g.56  ORF Transcript_42/g.56 Transcript_42/m.56 type:complete len:664 (+) Transcript_42:164-2155(+)|eukprot:CAMPEP_0184865932 /NCGR_PEP_ID=MMETSP0580-20130426/19799_1 /TAXON_ID=1118495 /ORGANISM="Dactyliosolen fragilissimus" /LENGTH=663 /DNA_ID=CAMNT_0027365331 /DNA_START=141 /DNA_END=2132 /DNA_ORIENTATION=+
MFNSDSYEKDGVNASNICSIQHDETDESMQESSSLSVNSGNNSLIDSCDHSDERHNCDNKSTSPSLSDGTNDTYITARTRESCNSLTLPTYDLDNGNVGKKIKRDDAEEIKFESEKEEKGSENITSSNLSRISTSSKAALTALASASMALSYENYLQKSLTAPPKVYRQVGTNLDGIVSSLSVSPDGQHKKPRTVDQKDSLLSESMLKGILTREIKPELFLGTRAMLASTAAYALPGPRRNDSCHFYFREVMKMGADGTEIDLDWEVPYAHSNHHGNKHNTKFSNGSNLEQFLSIDGIKAKIIHGPIDIPVIIILHGINNNASFGYIRSLSCTFAQRGWASCAMNFRGCGGKKLRSPRGYNAAYTGDLRNVVLNISKRLAKLDNEQIKNEFKYGENLHEIKQPHIMPNQSNIPLFLVGASLGANIMTKYLGEEGFNRSNNIDGNQSFIPSSVAGAVTLGNPLAINSKNLKFPYAHLLAAGIKRSLFTNWKAFSKMAHGCQYFRQALRQALSSPTIGHMDNTFAPFIIRNNILAPYTTKIGYLDGEDYWNDASSYKYVPHISVPLLQLSSEDDTLVAHPSRRSLSYCLRNPNIIAVETKCGGHLGWREVVPKDMHKGYGDKIDSRNNEFTRRWADVAAADFIQAVIEDRMKLEPDYSVRLNSKL